MSYKTAQNIKISQLVFRIKLKSGDMVMIKHKNHNFNLNSILKINQLTYIACRALSLRDANPSGQTNLTKSKHEK